MTRLLYRERRPRYFPEAVGGFGELYFSMQKTIFRKNMIAYFCEMLRMTKAP